MTQEKDQLQTYHPAQLSCQDPRSATDLSACSAVLARPPISYRPISLLSCLAKTPRPNAWSARGSCSTWITKEQTTFRRNKSSEDQLIQLAQLIENAFQEKKVIATFTDLFKAFNKVWKKGLLPHLRIAKVAGWKFSLITSSLCHRTVRITLNYSLSHTIKLWGGVTQGVISITIFTIFINDIATNLSSHSKALHADDFAMWNASESITTATVRMQETLNNTSKWASDWCITTNCQKTVATSTCFIFSNIKEKLHLSVNYQQIPKEETLTYLGIKLNQKLTWNPHIKEMDKRATRWLSLMKILACTNWGASSSILTQVNTGSVCPVLEYGTAMKNNTSRLAKVHSKGMCIITGRLKTSPTLAMETATRPPSLD